MLTNEQALILIRQHHECYVVWATDRRGIVSVTPMRAGATADERMQALAHMGAGYSGPTKGRFLCSDSTTLQTLIDEAAESDRIAGRVAIFQSWKDRSIEALIGILTNADFRPPMDVFHGSQHLVERLYKIHGPRLTPEHCAQLRAFGDSPCRHDDQRSAQASLRQYLCVLENDPSRLVAVFEQHEPALIGRSWSAFVAAVGDLRIAHPPILTYLINFVARAGMFGPRFDAMLALGKIGAPAGPRAAEVIVGAIYDSDAAVTALRDRIIKRIRSAPSDWIVCPACFHGYVDGVSSGLPSVQSCRQCFGIGAITHRDEPATR